MDKAGKRVYDISDKTEEEVLGPGNQLYIIGEKGAAAMDAMEEVTTRIDKLAVAKKMETSGKDAKIIKWATGWEKGIDGKWRYEIMDVSIKSDIAIRLTNDTWGKKASDFKPFKLTKFLGNNSESKALLKAYPQLKDVKIVISKSTSNRMDGRTEGSYNPVTNTITIEYTNAKDDVYTSALIHELQHVIQRFEGFTYGANIDLFEVHPQVLKLKKALEEVNEYLDANKFTTDGTSLTKEYEESLVTKTRFELQLQDLEQKLYESVAGETEARNVQARHYLAPKERRNTLLSDTEDVAREDQIIIEDYLNKAEQDLGAVAQALHASKSYKAISNRKEYAVLTKYLFEKFRGDSSYGTVARTANYWYLCDYFGDGKLGIRTRFQINGNESFLNAVENELKNRTFRDSEGFDRWFESFKSTKGKHYDGAADATLRVTNDGNAGVATSKFQKKNISSTRAGNGKGIGDIRQEFRTSRGEVYGFLDADGNIRRDFAMGTDLTEATDQEMQTIKAKAIADGTFMKAPNGKAPNLNEKQWLQVRTKAFKNWFGDWVNDPENASKVIDENGDPKVVYHGGVQNIEVFKNSSEVESNTGSGSYIDPDTDERIPIGSNSTIFFSDDPYVAKSYAEMLTIQKVNFLREKLDSFMKTFKTLI